MPRASGKTTMLIKESAKTGKPIIVTNSMMVDILAQRAKEMGLRIPEPVSAMRWIINDYGSGDRNRISKKARESGGLLIDDLDCVLKIIFGERVSKATYTPDKMDVIRSHEETQTLEEFEEAMDEIENLLDRLDKTIYEMLNEIGSKESRRKEEMDNMSKFKVGDFVRVRSVDEMWKSKKMLHSMEKFAETIHRITTVHLFSDEALYVLEGCECCYFDERMLEDKICNKDDIFNINVIVPDKVVEIEFCDGKEKMVCHKDDTFDLRKCCFIAIAKHLHKKEYTCEGIEYMAAQLMYQKKYVKIVDKALKEYNKKIKEEEKRVRKTKEEKLIYERQSAKRRKQKERREKRHRDELVNMIADAINQSDLFY